MPGEKLLEKAYHPFSVLSSTLGVSFSSALLLSVEGLRVMLTSPRLDSVSVDSAGAENTTTEIKDPST